ncbi:MULTISPECIES: LacI family DNA-binding transcriptional regulator [unclassified Actinomyces]|nr:MULTISPECIES: LacI family DNA-binding transcriptional regulator [unclassified Actinomyces]MCL3777104.1 LacI family DNA-binding transcriptional regulator [Actinomyces sp. AC-20-1]MCL3790645.1 LacI family DNA-binding transcriptional regulator [Actinomyces sp. 187325]MCL3792948.1 LacI family DNA-binding transcriptional regulator [Actinomyces sp. 186855]MCL3794768.1 LacI family DNA-binding transcriptional regulator [Actinomyces sp. 217892]
MAVTMHDVARLAGVSVKTVSNVVNDYPYVRESTRAKVVDAIEKLGYKVNQSARNLRRGSTGLLCLAVPELKLAYFAELADAVIAAAEGYGRTVLIEQTNSDRGREARVLHDSRQHLFDGLLFSPLELGQDDIAQFHVDYPLVLLGERVFGAPADHVTMANTEAAEVATAHLLGMGRRRVALVGAHAGEVVGSAGLREAGYRAAHARAGLEVDERLVREAGLWHRASGAEATRRLIEEGVDFDGVFALNDAMAIGALHELLKAGVRVPEDVAVIGFDDIEDTQYTQPSLSTIDPGPHWIAQRAVELLVGRIDERLAGAERAPYRHEVAPFRLVERGSTTG